MDDTHNSLPHPVLRRLPRYLARARQILLEQQEWASSHDLAAGLGLTSSTVRQDLSHLDLSGVSKRGYQVSKLEEALATTLRANEVHRTVIVGAGYLGCALALHGGLREHKFDTCGIFDADREIVGSQVGTLSVRPMSSLGTVVRRKKVELGIIAVPASAAQEVADRLVEAGVKGLLNLTYAQVHAGPGVAVVDARIVASLQELAYVIRDRNGGEKKDNTTMRPRRFQS